VAGKPQTMNLQVTHVLYMKI